MEVIVAKTAGFCFGVRRAVEQVYQQIEQQKKQKDPLPIYTYGPIIHNEEVVRDLEEKGVYVIDSKEELEKLEKGVIILRAHGVTRDIYDLLEKKELVVVDATCPFVQKIHKLVQKHETMGRRIIITGNGNHKEVEGIKSCCKQDVIILETEEEAEKITLDSSIPLTMVSQTTFNYNKFKELVEIISKKGYDIIVLNTICNATQERQEEAKRIAERADAMVVIGGRHSSNTQKLYEICKKECKNTYYIQTLVDLDLEVLKSKSSVGITAGASTPNNIIEEVHTNVRRI
ncbi:MAG: 4-hydroxy-3-methylbut-2-enyl diphosphate reductase [Lachnospiraceae bacterium]|nr:4-hydroxy-3-methylbut-2-enyl diphosphate reductase [Lachnospiraceae bacterium]